MLTAAAKGDKAAFTLLYYQYSSAVFSHALRLLGERTAAEDLTQEVFIKALKSLKDFRQESSLRHWLKRMTTNGAIDFIRSSADKKNVSIDQVSDFFVSDNSDTSVVEASGLLAKLDGISRQLIWLFLVEGWTHKELALRFNRTESWSKSIVSRALSQLRNEISTTRNQEHE